MRELIELGRARPEMLFSRDGADWVEGFDCPELFGEPELTESGFDPPPPPPVRGLGENPGLHRGGSRAAGRGRSRVEPHRGGAILALGILGLVFCGICGIFAWTMGNTDLAKMRAGRMDRSGESLTSSGRIMGIITVVLWLGALGLAMLVGIAGSAASSGPH